MEVEASYAYLRSPGLTWAAGYTQVIEQGDGRELFFRIRVKLAADVRGKARPVEPVSGGILTFHTAA